MKVKIGTQLDQEVLHDLKMAAAREKTPIGELIQTALVSYLLQQKKPSGRRNVLTRLLAKPPIHVSDDHFREVMALDPYDR